MIGNGPYKMDERPHRPGDRPRQERRLDRRLQRDTWDDRLDTITFRTSADPDTSYNAFEAGEGDNANIPPGAGRRRAGQLRQHPRRRDPRLVPLRDQHRGRPLIGGDENLKLRQAISAADQPRGDQRGRLQRQPHDLHRHHPGGHPGLRGRTCASTAPTTPSRPRRCSTSGRPRATRSPSRIPLQFNADAGHEPVVGDHGRQPRRHRHRGRRRADRTARRTSSELAEGCLRHLPGRLVRRLPDVRQLHVRPVPHRRPSAATTYGVLNQEFDALVDEAKQTVDPDEQAALFQEAEQILLNDDTGVIPINWYLRRLRLQRRDDRQLPADQLRSDPLGAGGLHRVTHPSLR